MSNIGDLSLFVKHRHGLIELVMRIVLGIEYNGSGFFGWQRQLHTCSVQQSVEEAISKVANREIRVHTAGRTDTGVHACEQVVHFDCDVYREEKAWVMGVNRYLPTSVSILWAKIISDEFHARFSAKSRRYRYVILNRAVRSALLYKQVTWIYHRLDLQKMQAAAKCLEGMHDFTSYRALACQAKSPIRMMHEILIQRENEFIFFDIHADGFLHHMVRNIVGVLISIGKSEHAESWAQEVLECRDRRLGGVTASPSGLYLVKVHYEDKYKLCSTIRFPAFAG